MKKRDLCINDAQERNKWSRRYRIRVIGPTEKKTLPLRQNREEKIFVAQSSQWGFEKHLFQRAVSKRDVYDSQSSIHQYIDIISG